MTRRRIPGTERLKIFIREAGICHLCGGKIAGKAWDISHEIPLEMGGADDGDNLRIAHRTCHQEHTAKKDVPAIRKAQRIERKHVGIKRPSRFPCNRDSGWKKKITGEVVRR